MTIKREAIRGPGGSEARAVGVLLMAGAGLVSLSLLLPHPSGGDTAALIATAAAMFGVGLPLRLLYRKAPLALSHLALAAAYLFPRRLAAAHLAWLLAVYAIALAAVDSTAGYSPVTRWLFTAVSLIVVMLFISVIASYRARADERARRFFELSEDMLCTMDRSGRCVEVNEAWKRWLGYGADDLHGRRLVDITHPDDRQRATEEALALFDGGKSIALEIRVQAKDGSWHWLRSSSVFAPDDDLVYARSTDVTELKRVEAEREELLARVEVLARHDALTGLPNRRSLDELLPREMARARRAESPLCLAIVDIDHFKAYNDAHGHLAGDAVLRECAIAWDSQLRGADSIVRFGGEEFLVVLPDCEIEVAVGILERLRAATPGAQTCSAGLACWDFVEAAESLLSRADAALYEAKSAGRDQLTRSA